MALTQMALDSLDFDATVALAAKVAPHVDILEIGTPCIKHNGIKLLEVLRAKFPNNKILVDLKTMDAGFYEAEPFYKAGADICTVLGCADIGTIKGVIDVANKYGKKAQVDLINVADKEARTKEVAKLGAHIIGVRVRDTTREIRIATARVMANSRNKRPTTSAMNSNGINHTT